VAYCSLHIDKFDFFLHCALPAVVEMENLEDTVVKEMQMLCMSMLIPNCGKMQNLCGGCATLTPFCKLLVSFYILFESVTMHKGASNSLQVMKPSDNFH